MRTVLLIFLAVLIALLVVGSSFFAVDRAEYVYVTQFGKRVQTYDGETEAGLHWKLPWPVQSVQRLDHRLQVFDLAGVELLTHDPKGNTIDKTLTISAYVCWRIADVEGVDRFIRAVGTPDRVEAILGQRITSRLSAEIGNLKLDEQISVAPATEVEQRMERLSRRLLEQTDGGLGADGESLRDNARRTYG